MYTTLGLTRAAIAANASLSSSSGLTDGFAGETAGGTGADLRVVSLGAGCVACNTLVCWARPAAAITAAVATVARAVTGTRRKRFEKPFMVLLLRSFLLLV